MKVGIVSQWYPPEPWFIPATLAESLAARGHQVRVLTGYPNYPAGRVYPGFRQRWNDRTDTGRLCVRRVPLFPSYDRSAVRRTGNYVSFAVSSALAAVRYLAGADVLYVYHTPPTVFAAPALLRLLYRIPSVLHIQDLWPESLTESTMVPSGYLGDRIYVAVDAVMRRVYRMANSIAVIAPTMRDVVVERGADPAGVRVVLNWTDESLFRPVAATEPARRELGARGRRIVMHAGNIGPFQDIAGAVRAAAMVERQVPLDLVLVGSGTEENSVRALAARLGAGNIRFLGRREPSRMAALYAAADYQLISLRDVPFCRGAIPSKLPAALACGSPVVASAAGDCARLVEVNGVGVACPPADPRALADRFRDVASLPEADRASMAGRALRSYRSQMSQAAGVDQLESMLAAAVAGDRSRPSDPGAVRGQPS